jgi:hypothetical protein
MRTRLIVAPIRDKGDAIVIIAWQGTTPMLGYVTQASIRECIGRPLSMCDCRRLVEASLPAIERVMHGKILQAKILQTKSAAKAGSAEFLPCIEVTGADFRAAMQAARLP